MGWIIYVTIYNYMLFPYLQLPKQAYDQQAPPPARTDQYRPPPER